ncbi:translocation/assembly module TamB domain-containing protein [Desulfobulbus oligotrophicus]|uniref:Translocation/assembly module TamB domain-containing protein n=1 Tax=Desulfobulbus oligotrophicus TaxID=1909699 RepID=A0A7T5VAZ4_9BACT|nr:translocation/assembly module TamB domain-containing protein [Desulfobulbus oligotrophicus]QQG64481.1 translocation/assembly module TamB domain-containing protein [Desulfobulbus oligotrophicus]
MIRSLLYRIVKLLVLLVPAVLVTGVLLLGTAQGLRFLTPVINHITAPLLTIGSVSGSLFSTIRLQNLQFADGIDTVRIDTITLSWEPTQLLAGRIHLKSIQAANVHVLLGTSNEDTLLSPLTLPILLELDALTLENVHIFSDGEEVWHINTVTLSTLTYHNELLRIRQLRLDSKTATLAATGTLQTHLNYPVEMEITGTIHQEGYTAVPGRGRIYGPLNDLTMTGTFDNPLSFQVKGHLKDLMTTTPTWQVQGTCPLLTPRALHTTWPDQPLSALIVTGRGTFDAYTVQMHTQILPPGFKDPGQINVALQGNSQGLEVQDLRLRHQKTELTAQGEVTWAPHLSWQAEVNGTYLNPALLHKDWPGNMTVAVTTSGQGTDHGVRASLHVTRLQGTVRQQQVTGTGEVHLENKQIRIPAFTLQSGGSSLQIKGSLADNLDLLLALDSSNLADLWPGASGRINANGRISGSVEKPGIDFKLTGSNLGINGTTVQKIAMETRGVFSNDGNVHGVLHAEKMHFGNISMTSGSLRLTGASQRYQLVLEGRTNLGSAGLSMDGTLTDGRWQGTINRARFLSQQYGNWQQRQPAETILSTSRADLDPLCIATTSSTLCIGGSWQKKENSWQLQGKVAALPLNLFTLPPFTTEQLSGSISGELAISGRQEQILAAQLTATTQAMSFPLPLADNHQHLVKWKKNVFRADYEKNNLQASVASELTDGSMLEGSLSCRTDQLSLLQLLQAEMTGSVHVNILDLSPVILLTNRKVLPSGNIQGKLTASGTLLAPVVQGQLELQNGQAEIPPLGITLSPLTLSVTGDGRLLHLLATARSGAGIIKAESEIPFDQSTADLYTLRLAGETFQAARIPGLDLVISPDIRLTFDHRQIEVGGTVTVPHADITSIDFDQGLAPSADVVVIDAEENDESTSSWPIFFDMTVLTGNEVLINAHGLRGYIDGKLTVQKQPGRPQTGNGMLSVRDGSFTLYGRRLKIDLGRLIFSGGSLTNPGIELRSERKNQKTTVGVIIDGFLQKPNINFYSTPALEQSTIITSLLESTAIGGETRQELGMAGTLADTIGIGGLVPYLQSIKELAMIDVIKFEPSDTSDSFSLVFGSWLTPNFYVSYGKDLAAEAATFNTRYTLGNGFFLLTETGALHNSGDIKYEFEQ